MGHDDRQIVVSISSEYQISTHVQICCCQTEPREGRTDVEEAMYAERYRARWSQYRKLELITNLRCQTTINKGPCRGKALLTVSLSRVDYRYRVTRHFTGHCDTSFLGQIKLFSTSHVGPRDDVLHLGQQHSWCKSTSRFTG